jgi:hypothetical protein
MAIKILQGALSTGCAEDDIDMDRKIGSNSRK